MLHRRLHSLDAPRAGISSGAILGSCGSHVNANAAMGEALLRFWSGENCGRAADSHRFSTGAVATNALEWQVFGWRLLLAVRSARIARRSGTLFVGERQRGCYCIIE